MTEFRHVLIALFVVLPSASCVRTVTGPSRIPVVEDTTSSPLRIVYQGKQWREPADFVPRLEQALSHEFRVPMSVERGEVDANWPVGLAEPRQGELTVLIRANSRWKCGNPAMASLMGAIITAGILPFLDRDDPHWSTELFVGPGDPAETFDFETHTAVIGWLPLIPVMPPNMLWRWIRGDEYDHFLRTFPSHVHHHALDLTRRLQATASELVQ